MWTSKLRRSLRDLHKEICSGKRGDTGLSYDEASAMFSHVWNLPYTYNTRKQSLHYYHSGRHKQASSDSVGCSAPLPLFHCDSPGEEWSHLEEEEEEEGEEGEEADGLREGEKSPSEIHEESPNVVRRVLPWAGRKQRVMAYLPPSEDSDIAGRVRSSLGYEFPPVMGKMLERMVREQWELWRKEGLIPSDDPAKEWRLYHSLVVDTQVFLAKTMERKMPIVCVSPSPNSSRFQDTKSVPQPLSSSLAEYYSSIHSKKGERGGDKKAISSPLQTSWNIASSSSEEECSDESGPVASSVTLPSSGRSRRGGGGGGGGGGGEGGGGGGGVNRGGVGLVASSKTLSSRGKRGEEVNKDSVEGVASLMTHHLRRKGIDIGSVVPSMTLCVKRTREGGVGNGDMAVTAGDGQEEESLQLPAKRRRCSGSGDT